VIKAAFDYRDYNLGVYGIELPMLKPWTSKASIIDIVLGLFDTTTKLVESPSTESEAVRMSSEPNMQLPELASVLFACIHERLEWLGRLANFLLNKGNEYSLREHSAVAADEAGSERERKELDERFGQLRPEVLETLRKRIPIPREQFTSYTHTHI
jgi:nuclear pore complex protein Nup133